LRKYSASPPNVDRLYQLPLLSNSIAKQKDAKISMFEEEEEKKEFGNIFYMNVFLKKSACVLSSKEQYNLIVVCCLSPHLHYRLSNILH